ncbi:response regulator [Pontibacter cellulosilyticus]|uniref:Response regulator n=1 Tax=Pontibacter cellulosilyticus TaxID=1720253 RepID=A0A923SIA4_9BACT|nr:response regulator [Pontibacter cellulosilyticus]MBC5992407.1 response regulator [Pontibacter cellulosilyticus]
MKAFVIDDDKLSVFLTQSILNLDAATQCVDTFLSAEAALDALAALKETDMPDVIFLDLNMPLMDGWDFLDALTSDRLYAEKEFNIYVLTSSLDLSDSVKAETYSIVSGFLHKPISSEDVSLIYSRIELQKKAEVR